MKKILSVLLLLALLAMSAVAAADSSVSYTDFPKRFEFAPGSVYQATDLFENFKGVLPGDVLTQKVVVRNDSQSDIRIWMQQTPETWVESSMPDFLERLRLTVTMEGRTLFDAQASEAAQLVEPVLLGYFSEHPRGETVLDVTLYVPIELGNDYENQLGVVPWTFMVEEIPNDGTPHTGDWFVSGVWMTLAGVLALAIFIVLLLMKKRKTAN